MLLRTTIFIWTMLLLANCTPSKRIMPTDTALSQPRSMHKKAYNLFDKTGKQVTYTDLLNMALGAEIVLFGELHNNPICHWLQFELTQDIDRSTAITLGLEMIEKDNQDVLDQYLSGAIDAEALDSTARLWGNYDTDYKPIIDYAKANNITVAASNIPRRYASMVYRNGFEILDTLPDEQKAWIAPLPIAYDASLPGYVKMLEMAGGHGGENFPKAQAIKDATMAHSILSYLEKDKIFIHYHGSFHSDYFEGILWYLKQQKPNKRYLTIATVEQDSIDNLEKEHLHKADFILCIPSTMTKTY